MPETLSVHLNRDEPREVAPETATLETDRSFVLEFVNHGGPIHVHLQLDDALARVVRLPAAHVYVDGDATRRVDVSLVENHDPAKGYVELTTGYGAERARVNVTVTNRRKDGGPEVAVDESLAEKQPSDASEAGGSPVAAAKPVALGTVAVVLAALLALSVSDSLAIFVGVLALLGGVGAAAYVLYA